MALGRTFGGANFYAMVNGQSGGYLKSMTVPTLEVDKIAMPLGPDGVTKQALGRMKLGDAKVVCGISESNALWQLIESVMKKNCQPCDIVLGVADQNYVSKRETELTHCLIKEVSFAELDAQSGKDLFDVPATFAPEAAKFSNGSGSVIKGNLSGKQKGWQKSYFDPIGFPGGIPPQAITKIALAKHAAKITEEHTGMSRWPTKTHAAWTVDGLKIEGSALGYGEARDLCVKIMYDGFVEEKEFTDCSVNIKDPTHTKTVGEVVFIQIAPTKFTTGAENKGGEDKAIQWSMDMAIEEQYVTITQKM